ncbi:hypothetical protein KSP40_PGU021463 [Platanthera guangdongensis]|uniref:Uncharacterized protein n=1 Tax=Platanthera guangdongensis TaxID=2320717 RepID=A0ABR2MP77_9ASPA
MYASTPRLSARACKCSVGDHLENGSFCLVLSPSGLDKYLKQHSVSAGRLMVASILFPLAPFPFLLGRRCWTKLKPAAASFLRPCCRLMQFSAVRCE